MSRLIHISKPTIARAKRKQWLHGDIEGGKKKAGEEKNLRLKSLMYRTAFLSLQTDRLTRPLCK